MLSIVNRRAASRTDWHRTVSPRYLQHSGDEAEMRLEEVFNQRTGHVDQFDDLDCQLDDRCHQTDHANGPFDFLFTHGVLQK